MSNKQVPYQAEFSKKSLLVDSRDRVIPQFYDENSKSFEPLYGDAGERPPLGRFLEPSTNKEKISPFQPEFFEKDLIVDSKGRVIPQFFDEDVKHFVPNTNVNGGGGIGGGGVTSIDGQTGNVTGIAKKADVDAVAEKTDSWVSALSYGDLSIDFSDSINLALEDAVTKGINKILVPRGNYSAKSSISVKKGVDIDFSGSKISVPMDVSFDVFSFNNVNERTKLSNVFIQEASRRFKATGDAIRIKGNSSRIILDNVNTNGCRNGINIASEEGSLSQRVTLRDCYTEFSASYGINVENARIVLIDNCFNNNHWFDGIKLTKNAKQVTINNGESSFNGESIVAGFNGNGLDAYAGGDSLVVVNLIAENNKGSGVYIKSGELNFPESSYGFVQNIQLINIQSRNNTGAGLDFSRNGDSTLNQPLVANVSVFGGVYENNGTNGIYIKARNVSITSPIIRDNQEHGVNIVESANVSIYEPIITANSRKTPSVYSGISIAGKRVKIHGGVINGCDDRYAPSDLENVTKYWAASTTYLAGDHVKVGGRICVCTVSGVSGTSVPSTSTGQTEDGTVTWSLQNTLNHLSCVAILPLCSEISVKDVSLMNWNSGNQNPISVSSIGTQGSVFVDYGALSTASTFGSQGSTLQYNGDVYVKATPITDLAGWDRQIKKSAAQNDSSATELVTLKNDFNALLSKLRTAKLML